ncbi:MAG: 8-amino-7-oxononanoate synthase [Planctomycetota bacterium]|nr:8-amino-7-oxononanoate synthase [Planctomycetota bacterium]
MSFDWLDAELQRLRDDALWRDVRTVTSLPDGWCEVDGRRVRNLSSNDYLNLAHDPRVVAAARESLDEAGVGSGASSLVSGRSPWHQRLEAAICDFEGTEAAILFPSGYAANVGTVSALVQHQDRIFCDRLNHASLVDGCRMSGARLRVYRHDRLEVLQRELQKPQIAGRRWIVTDAVFSMDGDLAPLPDLCDLAERFGAQLIVDEAHGTGVFGANGRGVCEHFGVEDRVEVRIGTLSKAIGTLGGFVACSSSLRDWLWHAARTQVFSTALPPAICAAAAKSLELIRAEPQRREHLHQLSETFRSRLAGRLSAEGRGPIVPVRTGVPEAAPQLAARLLEEGYLVGAIRPPTVPRGTSRLRVCVSAGCTQGEMQCLGDLIVAQTEPSQDQ